jgi:hypothetical protein
MADDLRLVASNIAASLILSGAVSVKDSGSEAVVKNAVSIFSMVLTEVMDRDRQGKLYKQP